ncbi:MAG: imidazole glycerol phosphate synthase subunit HisH [Shewanella sp.]|nr:imidazole glycerol phosphate synthase subunit HisH [Shewanella sp.]
MINSTDSSCTLVASNTTVIIDTGVCNLTSVYQAIKRLTDDVVISDEPDIIQKAARVILPGVGSASSGMLSLKDKKLDRLIPELKQPVLGICLGMQLLTIKSQESRSPSADVDCMGCIPTTVNAFKKNSLPLPHMGWNKINSTNSHPIFNKLTDDAYVYFVHGFNAPISDYTIADCKYSETFSAAISNNNFIGLQFHPEKSGAIGSQILENFIEMNKGNRIST